MKMKLEGKSWKITKTKVEQSSLNLHQLHIIMVLSQFDCWPLLCVQCDAVVYKHNTICFFCFVFLAVEHRSSWFRAANESSSLSRYQIQCQRASGEKVNAYLKNIIIII